MRVQTITGITLAVIFAGTAQAAIPQINATCPNNIEVHADEGGPVYIGGKEAKLKTFNANYYEASLKGVTISISINSDGSPSVSYTKKGAGNGMCSVK
ncbi:MAG: hypothetical protein AAAB35_17860 [Phyllobacterium sp.]|uniref:hypothetical protein n=1 Tax=Phyllobacterium sp. TaxID=1871046 RepID=UPI0030F141D1